MQCSENSVIQSPRRPGQAWKRDGKAECFGCLEIDDQFDLGRLLHRQIGRFFAFENTSRIAEKRKSANLFDHLVGERQQ
jgi:hypothetical protein